MARILSEGFELNSKTIYANAVGTTSAICTISNTTKRSGSYALKANPSSSGGSMTWQYTAMTTNSIYYYRFYLYLNSVTTANGIIAFIYDSFGPYFGIQLNTDKSLAVYYSTTGVSLDTKLGSNSSVLNTGQWYRVEMAGNFNTNALTAYIDGTSFSTGTITSVGGGALDLGLEAADGTTGSFTADIYFDDVAINNNSGSFQATLPGAGQIIHLQPNAAGDNNAFTTQVGGTAGATNNFTRVDEITPDDATSYNGDTVLNNTDDFNITDTPATIGSSDTINVVAVGIRFNGASSTAEASFKVRVKKASAGTVSSSAAITPNSTTWKTNANAAPTNYPLVTYQDPDAGAWTKATLDTSQIGYTISTTNTNAANISTIWMLVDSTPASGPAPSSLVGGTLSMLGVG